MSPVNKSKASYDDIIDRVKVLSIKEAFYTENEMNIENFRIIRNEVVNLYEMRIP